MGLEDMAFMAHSKAFLSYYMDYKYHLRLQPQCLQVAFQIFFNSA